MNNQIDCGFGVLNTAKYPVISFKSNSVPPKVKEVNLFIEEFIKVIQRTSGKFSLIIDSSDLTFISRDSRESLAIGLQFVEREFEDRYLRNIFVINKIHIIILLQLVKLVVRPVVKQKLFMNRAKADRYAEHLLKKHS